MIKNEEIALKAADFLLQIKAIKIEPTKPFSWASGWKAPIYCDMRKIISYPTIRTFFRQEFVNSINANYSDPELIVGVATGGIAMGALVAQDLGLPFAYVRSSSKSHGLQQQIEGVVRPGQSAIVIEDLVSTGKSSLNAVQALQEAEVDVKGMIATFTYGFPHSVDAFKNANFDLTVISDYKTMLKVAVEQGYIKNDSLELLSQWRITPESWGQDS